MCADKFVVIRNSLPKWLLLCLPAPWLASPQDLKLSLTELNVIIRIFNALLVRENWAKERLLRYVGKTIRLAWRRSIIDFSVNGEGLVQPAGLNIVPDVIITMDDTRVDASRLLSLRSLGDESLFIDAIHISGEAGLAQLICELARYLHLDFEDILARYLGDIPSIYLLRNLRAVSRSLSLAVSRCSHNIAEFLAEERYMVLGRPAFEEHHRAQTELDKHLDVLAAQIDSLKQSFSAKARLNSVQPHIEGQG